MHQESQQFLALRDDRLLEITASAPGHDISITDQCMGFAEEASFELISDRKK